MKNRLLWSEQSFPRFPVWMKVYDNREIWSRITAKLCIGILISKIKIIFYSSPQIISTFPRDWFSSLDGDSTLPQLENLCRYLVSAARTLHAATAREKDAERLEGRWGDLTCLFIHFLLFLHQLVNWPPLKIFSFLIKLHLKYSYSCPGSCL